MPCRSAAQPPPPPPPLRAVSPRTPQRRVVAPQWPCRSAQWLYRGRAPCAHLAVSWPRSQYNAMPLAILSQYNPRCIAICFHQKLGCSCHKTICCIVTQAQPTLSIAIHSSVLQYTAVYCNTLPAFEASLSAIQ